MFPFGAEVGAGLFTWKVLWIFASVLYARGSKASSPRSLNTKKSGQFLFQFLIFIWLFLTFIEIGHSDGLSSALR